MKYAKAMNCFGMRSFSCALYAPLVQDDTLSGIIIVEKTPVFCKTGVFMN